MPGRPEDTTIARFTGRVQRVLDEVVSVAHDVESDGELGTVSAYYCSFYSSIDPNAGPPGET